MAEIIKKRGFQTALVGLRDKILTGELVKGDHLSEVVLAADLGISRTPLREAMRELTDQGLIEKLPNGRYQVCSLTRNDVRDFIALRGIIEGNIFRLSAEKGISEEQRLHCFETLTAIDKVLNVSSSSIDFDEYMDLNAKLHDQFASICASTVMLNELARVSKLPMASPGAFWVGRLHRALPSNHCSRRRISTAPSLKPFATAKAHAQKPWAENMRALRTRTLIGF
ncbi:MAG: GntR family transcriptional regulator [Ahrensia sp.]|nr:GntR family transcriptional regulator [Ahrensia sp.]